MIEFAGVSEILQAVGVLYWLFAVGALIAAWKWSKGRIGKGMAILVVLGLFAALPVTQGIRNHKANQFSAEAFARFNKYCTEKAGEKIHKKVEGVESVVVMRPRSEGVVEHAAEQFWRGDPYGVGHVGSGELKSLLGEERLRSTTPDVRFGFQFLEVNEKISDGQDRWIEYRTGDFNERRREYDLASKPVEKRRSKYGFTWDDISTDEDRKYWIAASLLKIVDLDTNETIAERYGYMIDRGFGNTNAGRSPWLMAIESSCPRLVFGEHVPQTRRFVIRSLNPRQKGG